MKPSKEIYQFTLQLEDIQEISDEIQDILFEAGCDDALLHSRYNKVFLDFDREGESFKDAVKSAIDNLKSAGYKSKLFSQ